LSLAAGFNCVLSETKTPASDYTQAILNAQNNYWTVNFSSGFVVDDKTDLNVNYYYYRSDNYVNNSAYGQPFGAGDEQHSITATITRRITKAIKVSLKYGFFHNRDETSGGNNNYDAHLVYASMEYRF
jgi:predicted porin